MPQSNSHPVNPLTLLVKSLLLFVLLNLAFAWLYPMPQLGRLSLYNHLFPGRLRLPYSDQPEQAYSLTLDNLEAMFAAHEISAGPKPADEYRVLLIGDSATWGFLLPADQTLAAALNAQNLRPPDGRRLRAYNLGYPVMSVTKDLLILSVAVRYQPDLVVWPLTLESLPYDKQLFSPLLQHNAAAVRDLIQTYHLSLDPNAPELSLPTFWQRTLIGARRPLADLIRLQLYGPMWAATGIDQAIPTSYARPQSDLPADESFHNLRPPHLTAEDLAFEALLAGRAMLGATPVLLVNEPIFISQGKNSNIRYNYYYPRWAYDDYRQLLAGLCAQNRWDCLDLWNLIPPEEFTNTAVHLSAAATRHMAALLGQEILRLATTP